VALDEHLKRIQGSDPNLQLGRRRSQFGASTRLGGNSHARFRRASTIADKGAFMASESSFDIVSKVDRQEADNALNQAAKEINSRYDFRGTDASIAWSGEAVQLKANSEDRVKAILDVFQSKLVKRGISLKSLEDGEPYPSGKEYRIDASLKEGIDKDNAKKISKIIRDEGPKGVKAQIQGDELRVSSKKRDDLQEVIALLKGQDLDVDLQFTNYR